MSQSLPIAPRSPAVCFRCGQATFHIRSICRACDPCTVTLLAAADAALSADQTPARAAMVGEQPDNRLPVRELVA
jgi:hypothetical protein